MAASKKNPNTNNSSNAELINYISRIAQDPLPPMSRKLLDEIKEEAKIAKQNELKDALFRLQERIKHKVIDLRHVRREEKAILSDINKIEGDMRKLLMGTPMEELTEESR